MIRVSRHKPRKQVRPSATPRQGAGTREHIMDWLAHVFGRSLRCGPKRVVRPGVELLETRALPSVSHFTAPAGTDTDCAYSARLTSQPGATSGRTTTHQGFDISLRQHG